MSIDQFDLMSQLIKCCLDVTGSHSHDNSLTGIQLFGPWLSKAVRSGPNRLWWNSKSALVKKLLMMKVYLIALLMTRISPKQHTIRLDFSSDNYGTLINFQIICHTCLCFVYITVSFNCITISCIVFCLSCLLTSLRHIPLQCLCALLPAYIPTQLCIISKSLCIPFDPFIKITNMDYKQWILWHPTNTDFIIWLYVKFF